MHFMMRAKALVAFPGGFGTPDELFEVLTLVQTGKKPNRCPSCCLAPPSGRSSSIQAMVEEGNVSPKTWASSSIPMTRKKPGDFIKGSTGCKTC